jgi:hypothetical protein
MEKLIIAWHQNTLSYATIWGGGYWPQVIFKLGDYVYM